MLAIVLFETRRGQRQPRQWYQDTQKNGALWWLGFGLHPARSCWYAFRDRLGPYLATCNAQVWHQAVDEEGSGVMRGALEGSAVAVNASRRRLLNDERLHQRLAPLTAACHADAQGHTSDDVPSWMATPQPLPAQPSTNAPARRKTTSLACRWPTHVVAPQSVDRPTRSSSAQGTRQRRWGWTKTTGFVPCTPYKLSVMSMRRCS
jgi:hypothetical protein